jgi:3-hydroxyisobutyrate dehydrogenase
MAHPQATSEVRRSVGVIGLGQMGRGIAANLDRAGLLRAVFDIDPEACGRAGLAADVPCLSPSELGDACDTVLFVVPASPQIESCLSGPDGLLTQRAEQQILVDLTTYYPADTLRLARMAGSAAGADAGTLTLMAGGDREVVERVRPVLDAIANRVFHVGASSAGHALKLVHNMVLHSVFLATCEGCRVAEHAGIDLETAIEVFNAGNARSFITENRFPRHILSGTFDGRSTVSNLAKDLGMAARFAQEIGAPALYGPLTSALLDKAVENGMGREDFTRLYPRIDELLEAEARERSGA